MIKTFKIVGIAVILLGFIYVLWAAYIMNTLPGLSYGAQGLTIFNCDEPRNENAASVCPKLFCEKYLRENRKIDENSIVQVTEESHSIHSPVSIIQGIIKIKGMPDHANLHYYCRMEDDRILEAGVMTGKEWVNKLTKGELEI